MHQASSKPIVRWYTCEFCGRRFGAQRERTGPKLCRNCIEIRRLIRSWVRDGVWVSEAQEPKQKE